MNNQAKSILIFIMLLIAGRLAAQKNLVFKSFNIDSGCTILGLDNYEDKQYVKYAFYITDPAEIKKVTGNLAYGEKTRADTLDADFSIFMVKDKEVLPIDIFISPKYKYIEIEGTRYTFDVQQLQTLAKTYPLKYSTKLMKFTRGEDYDAFRKKHQNDPGFLGFEDWTEELEGSGSITMNATNTSASEGWATIEKDLKALGAVKEKDYILSYSPAKNEYKVQSSSRLWNKLQNSKYKKGKWVLNVKEIMTYWKK